MRIREAFSLLPILPVLLIFLSACEVEPPTTTFEEVDLPAAPDYSQTAFWSSLPSMEDYADLHPETVSPGNQSTTAADVFFIHPTTFMESQNWNANLFDQELNVNTDSRAIKHQASIFNLAGRVFAPRYRQLVYSGFFSEDKQSMNQAGMIAYADVKAAFDYYMEHWNHGRPIIIAGHSQGAMHGKNLLKEYFDGTELQSKLVAAYLPGWPIEEGFYDHIPASNAPEQTGCVSTWCTFKMGYEPDNLESWYGNAIVTNPINWKSDGTPSEKAEHKGFLMENYKKIYREAVNAEKHAGILWISNPIPLLSYKNYHVGDFNLFWLDVRENAALRVESFLRQQEQLAEDRE